MTELGKGSQGGTIVPDVRCHMWDMKLSSGIEVSFVSDDWRTDALILSSTRG